MPVRPPNTDWNVSVNGSYVRASTDPKPTVAEGAREGDTLYLWDTGEAFIHDGTNWRAV